MLHRIDKNINNRSFQKQKETLLKRVLLLLVCMVVTVPTTAQDSLGTEVVNIVKPYTPTISDAFKVKQSPKFNDSITTKKRPVQYSIFSVPVASTFTPAKGKATTVEKAKRIKLYDNYATLGFGNYTTILGELYSNFELSRTDNAGFFFRHNSTQGGIDEAVLENKYYDTRLDGHYTSRQRDASYTVTAGVQHQLLNWYGLGNFYQQTSEETIREIDPEQTYLSGYVGGNIALKNSAFEKVEAEFRFFSDAYDTSEINFIAKPEFKFSLNELNFTLDTELDYVSGNSDEVFGNTFGFDSEDVPLKYSYLNVGVTPSLVYINNDLSLSLGAAAYVSLDGERSESNLFIYPKINVSYRLVNEVLIAYGGADGNLQQNSYYNFIGVNPFVSPTLQIAPTSNLYEAFAGLKGKLSNSIGYNIRGSYGSSQDQALFIANPAVDDAPLEDYEYGNTFSIAYDDVTTLTFFGELKFEISKNFSFGANGSFYRYDTKDQAQAWNLPTYEARLFSNFNITEKLYGGASVFLVGERKDRDWVVGPLIDTVPLEVTLDSYIDANFHLGYRVNDRLSVFLKGSNLLGDSYQKWQNYPVQGIQGLMGATYKFDW